MAHAAGGAATGTITEQQDIKVNMAKVWTLASRPTGLPHADNFALADIPLAPLEDGAVHVVNRWLSVDPAMRVRMIDMESYVAKFEIGEPLAGTALGKVVASRATGLPVGTLVKSQHGWRDEIVAPAADFQPLAKVDAPEIAFMGALGGTGMTAMVGLFDIADAKPGEVVLVTGAAGAVGSVVVQVAKAKGMTVIAAAGGPEKCAWLESLGADAVIDYKSPGAFDDKLRAAAPAGIDVCFDNVGGDQLNAAIGCARNNARMALCGMISSYQDSSPLVLKNAMRILTARIKLSGYLVFEYPDRIAHYMVDVAAMLKDGRLRTRETVFDGLAAMPDAFLGLFEGRNFGKALVRLPASQD